MTDSDALLAEISEVQNEIISFTWNQVADLLDKMYIVGVIRADENGHPRRTSGNFRFGARDGQLLKTSQVMSDEEFYEGADYIIPRIKRLHGLLLKLQGRAPVRFRWTVDVTAGTVESEWTYYEDLTDEEKEDDSWMGWEDDERWWNQLQAELAQQQPQPGEPEH